MGLFSSITGLFGGGKDRAEDLSDELRELGERARFQPFNISGPLGSSSFDLENNTATATLSPDLRRAFDRFGQLIGEQGRQAANFDPQDFQNRFFDALDRLESRRESEAFGSLESRLFNRSGINTGTQRQVRDFRDTLDNRRRARAFEAIFGAQDFQSQIFNNILGLERGRSGLGQNALSPIQIGAGIGATRSRTDLAASNLIASGAGVEAGIPSFAERLGGVADDAFAFAASGGFSEVADFFGF